MHFASTIGIKYTTERRIKVHLCHTFGANSRNWNNYVASPTCNLLQDSVADQSVVEKQKKKIPWQCHCAFNQEDLCVRASTSAGAAGVSLKRIRSVPGNRVLPVRSSAIIHPTDQISTEKRSGTEMNDSYRDILVKRSKVRVNVNHLSCCNASSSTWSPVHGTNEWPRSRSSRRQCAVPSQSPISGNMGRRQQSLLQNIHSLCSVL